MSGLVEGIPEDDIRYGERYAESPVTGEIYRVTKWVEKGDGKITAIEKELWPKCHFPGCGEIQEFPTSENCELCLDHSMAFFYYWEPLAEFGPIDNTLGGDA